MSSVINATTTSGLQIQPDNSGSLQLKTNNGTTAVTIDTSQNVGIGTTSPADSAAFGRALDVAGSAGNGSSVYVRANASATNYLALGQDIGGTSYIINRANSPTLFYTNNTERMRIDSSGRLIMASVSGGNGGRISVGNNTGMTNTPHNAFTWAYATNLDSYPIGSTAISATQGLIGFFESTGSVIGAINRTGVNSVAYVTSSDYRLKEKVIPMTGALDKVAQLKPVTYTWKLDGSDGQGFIAHELQEVIPDAVTGEKDAVETYTDEDGVEQTRPKYQGVDTSFLVATLTAAIQEQQTIINDLKARIETLEGATS